MASIIDSLNNNNKKIENLDKSELKCLAKEIREFLVTSISKTGGHLSSNLGVVELTIAMHSVFNITKDKFVWDVGHQSYVHKILTGRKAGFERLRKLGGLSGFPKTLESRADSFNTGHSSTSISAGLGMVKARELNKDNYSVISVIGDGALTGGMAFEALNNAARLKSNFIIVLNDNNMSIDKNVGALSKYLNSIRTEPKYKNFKQDIEKFINQIPAVGPRMVRTVKKSKNSIKQLFVSGMLFEELGIKYIGPIDGHNIDELITNFGYAKRVNGPVLLHVKTTKGKGYKFAEKNPGKFHGIEPFEIITGNVLTKKKKLTFTETFSNYLVKLGKENDKIVAISAAMPNGTGINKFAKEFPDRAFDVGIAEQHAVTFAAGMAISGYIPVVAIYSSFLQRAYDQIIHDVCIQNLPVIFAIDRAGIVGEDGDTHQGIFDLSYLSHIPNLTIMCPSHSKELEDMLDLAVSMNSPVAIRYPKGKIEENRDLESHTKLEVGKAEVISNGKDIAILAVGSMVNTGRKVNENFRALGFNVTVVNMRYVKPFDTQLIDNICSNHKYIFTLEENVCVGGFGREVLAYISSKNNFYNVVTNISLEDKFIEHGTRDELCTICGLDENTITEKILTVIK
ncbi:MAG: 1-deoxy-D-xylulose-5-phosphate synthase [Clostridiales bacterium]|jgi:1-deoxy-D-xylulose-5-phosphate synthase|nr:1-deoxy-D-xylulose-5-phosphate synthase [Clostridiales bacterium]